MTRSAIVTVINTFIIIVIDIDGMTIPSQSRSPINRLDFNSYHRPPKFLLFIDSDTIPATNVFLTHTQNVMSLGLEGWGTSTAAAGDIETFQDR